MLQPLAFSTCYEKVDKPVDLLVAKDKLCPDALSFYYLEDYTIFLQPKSHTGASGQLISM